MALHRILAHMRYSTASGLATWCRDNMAVRFAQAVHVNPGLPNEEAPVNEVVDEGATQRFRCDLPLMNEAHAADAFNTLSTASVIVQTLPLPGSAPGETRPSWVEHHTCDHDAGIHSGCTTVSHAEGPA